MINSVFFDELYKQFAWFDSVFTPVVKNCSSEFFYDGFEYKLASISTNMNVLSQNETFFVTKVKINAKNDVYIRISQDAINVILDKVLGKTTEGLISQRFQSSKLELLHHSMTFCTKRWHLILRLNRTEGITKYFILRIL